MHRTERLVIYTLILLAIGLALGFRGIARPAHATGSGDEQPLIGVVDVIGLIEDGLAMEPYRSTREQARNQMAAPLIDLEQQIQGLEEELRLVGADQLDRSPLMAQYQQLIGQYQRLKPQLLAQFEQMSAGQAAELYAKIHAAADAVGAREGYDYVVACRVPTELGATMGLAAVTQQVLSRPLLRGVVGNDLTDLVREQTGIPAPPPVDTTPPPMPDEIPGMMEPGSMPGGLGDAPVEPGEPVSDGGMEPLDEPAQP